MHRPAISALLIALQLGMAADAELAIPPPTSAAGYAFAERHGMRFAWIPKGLGVDRESSRTGSPRILMRGEGHFMGVFEVTQGNWEHVMKEKFEDYLSNAKLGWDEPVPKYISPDKPAYFLDFKAASRLVEKLNELEAENSADPQWRFSIPSEEEWEHAARAGVRTDYLTGKFLMPHAGAFSFSLIGMERKKLPEQWYRETLLFDNLDSPCTVGSRSIPNAFGLYDVHGNVSEITRTLTKDVGASLPEMRDTVVYVSKGGAWCTNMESCSFKATGWAGEQLGRTWTGLRVMAHEVEGTGDGD